MTLEEVKDWLKTVVQSPKWYIGKINGNDKQCIGVYPTQGAITGYSRWGPKKQVL